MKIDGRFFLAGNHLSLLLISMAYFNLQRSWFQLVSAYVTAIIVEICFYYFSDKNRHRKLMDCIFSAIAEGAGLLILIKSTFDWFYVALAAVAVSSKYLLKKGPRDHLFNPTNFAIVVVLAFIPRKFFEIRGDEFNLSFYPIIHVIAFGILAVIIGKTWRIALSYFLTIISVSFILSVIQQESMIYLLGPEIGATGLIFMFLMITDPRTTPGNFKEQVFFGVALGVLLYALRFRELYYGHFLALFILTLLWETGRCLNLIKWREIRLKALKPAFFKD